MKRLFLVAIVAVNSLAPAATVIQTFNDIADVALNNNLALIDLDAPGGSASPAATNSPTRACR